MKTVVYCKEGIPISDFDAEDFVEGLKVSKDGLTMKISTSIPFDMIRREIVYGNIDPDSIVFEFEGKTIRINKYGAILNWPHGFCDKFCDVAEDIILKAVEIRKAEREQ